MSMSLSDSLHTVVVNNPVCHFLVDVICMHMAYVNQSILDATLSHHSKIHFARYCWWLHSLCATTKIQYKRAIFVPYYGCIFIIFIIICVLQSSFVCNFYGKTWEYQRAVLACKISSNCNNIHYLIVCACACVFVDSSNVCKKKIRTNKDNTFLECNFYYCSDSEQQQKYKNYASNRKPFI